MVNPAASATGVHGHAAAPAPQKHGFHLLLAEFNPLQYIPVVGTIYRALTHDTIPETARIAGSLVVSGLTGGPIGVALNLGMTALEKLVGVDPETIGQSLVAAVVHPAHGAVGASAAVAFSPAQLAAYSAHAPQGARTESDVLNDLELVRLA